MRNWSNVKLVAFCATLYVTLIATYMGAIYLGFYVHWN